MKKNVKVRVICLIVAAVMLSGAVTAAAIMGSPYDILKKAALDAIVSTRNATVEGTLILTIDGVQQNVNKSHIIRGDKGYLAYYYDENGEISGFWYNTDGLSVNSPWIMDDGKEWYSASISQKNDVYGYNHGYRYYSILGMGASVDDRDSAQMRFMELLIDLVVGDLKNNVTMTSENGTRSIRCAFTGSQVPEIVKAAIDIMVEQSGWTRFVDSSEFVINDSEYIYEHTFLDGTEKKTSTYRQSVRLMTDEEAAKMEDGTYYDNFDWNRNRWHSVMFIDGKYYISEDASELISERTEPATRDDYTDHIYRVNDIPMKNLSLNHVRGEAEVDANGNLLNVNVTGSATVTDIFGDKYDIELSFNAQISDIGTSNPVCPIPGAEQFLIIENMESLFGIYGYAYVYFTLNEDGSINKDSVTTTHPGEQERVNYNVKFFDTVMPMPVAADTSDSVTNIINEEDED